MCLIILRAFSGVPSIIMGESGVGKTALIDFLVR
jgi:putative ribosome biogenesis GTPase RsgA